MSRPSIGPRDSVESVRMGVRVRTDGRTFVSMVVMKRALAHTARLSPGVSEWDVDGGDMATWKARAAARVSGTRTRVTVMVCQVVHGGYSIDSAYVWGLV